MYFIISCAYLLLRSEYYFSADNLVYDTYLHGLMDGEGFVHLSEIANFRRVVKLNVNARQVRIPQQHCGLVIMCVLYAYTVDAGGGVLFCAAGGCRAHSRARRADPGL